MMLAHFTRFFADRCPLSQGLVIATTGPAIILAILGATYLVALRRNNHHSRNSSGRSSFFGPPATPEPSESPEESSLDSPGSRSQQAEEEQQQQQQQQVEAEAEAEAVAVVTVIRNRHLSVALFVLFVVYATVSYIVFETFVCDGFEDGTSYLRADYGLECEFRGGVLGKGGARERQNEKEGRGGRREGD